MNESHERSYYEVALTNNQVLSALAVLLLCLLAAFVAGMWVAKEAVAGEPAQVAVAESGAADLPESEAGEFRFFKRQGENQGDGSSKSAGNAGARGEESDKKGQSPEVAAEPPKPEPSRVVRNIRPVEVASNEPEREGVKIGEPVVRRPSVDPESSAAPAKQAQQPAARPDRDPEATAINKPGSGTTASARPTTAVAADTGVASGDSRSMSEMLVVQVLSSADQEQAGKVVVQLKDSGYRAFLSPAQVEGRTMYRVRVGPYSDRTQAEEASDRIKRTFRLNTWITVRS